ncbi:MAG TPA: universal stress protein [Jatrophihabitans sp.]|jgi:nucleotide-binding universal stress UspA family protein|uniref:universal stress protein n=1 Tax=Jatrophihabitans sp. TaxID=1932789 RepID=UPI002DFB907D|nr:universal stress protein [Jatrophihabitans sp.]
MTETQPDVPRIVVGVDGSEPSKRALRWAARIAASEGARIDAVAAWDFTPAFGWNALPMGYSPQLDIEKSLTDTVDEVFGTDRPKDLRLITLEGRAPQVLITASKGALMLVVGSRGHGGFMGLLLGSVSSAVAEHATCPVLVVHEPGTTTEHSSTETPKEARS